MNVTHTLPRVEYLLEFLKLNKSINDFKSLHLFPFTESWNGSEIPLIVEKLQFLQTLKKQIKDSEYLEHIQYINELCIYYEQYQAEVEMREYMENYQ